MGRLGLGRLIPFLGRTVREFDLSLRAFVVATDAVAVLILIFLSIVFLQGYRS